ncbi:PREDICTED: mucin-5B-like [Priapulus caudatus]|uniref:Mucin-5B-like n=1 Tax=Priapulus caudatus TaxID=37621 RepID=A0ABM1E3F6_PRICU|nr:PREDICTED: mucin-5B-like [Priapulus caudatus]
MPTSSVPDTVVPTLSVAGVVMPLPSIPAISVSTSDVASTNDVALHRQSATEAPSADNNGIVTDSTLDCRRAGALAERSMDFDVVLPSMIGGERQQLSTINLGDLEEDSCGVGASRDGTAAPSGCCRTLPETAVETSSLQQPLRAAHATSQKLDPAAGYCSHGRSSEDTRPSITVDLSGALLTASLERMSTAPSGSGKNGLERSPKERFLQSLYLSPRTLRAMAAAKRNDMRSRGMMEDGTASGVAAVHGTASSTISVVQVNSCGVSGPAVTHGDHHEATQRHLCDATCVLPNPAPQRHLRKLSNPATQRHLCEFDAASSDTSYIDRVIGCPRRTAAPADGTTIHDEPITSSQLTGQSPSTPWWHTPPSCTTDNILSLNSPRRPRILSRTPRRHLAASTPSSVSKQLRFGNIGSGLGAASVRDALAGGASVGDKPTGGVGICVPRTAGAGVDVPPTGPGDASVCVTATGDSSISVTSAGDSSVTVIDTGDSSVTVIDTGGASISVTPERNPAQLCADITTTTHVSRNRILSCQVGPLDGACIQEPIQTNPASGIPVQGCQQLTTQANMSIQPPLQQEQLVSSGHREGTNTVLDFIGGAHADNATPKPSDGAWLQLVSGLSVLPQSASVMTSYSNELPGMALLASACYPCPPSVDTQVLPPSVTTEQLTIEHGGVSSSARQFGTHVLPPAGDEVLGRHGHGEANEVDLLVGAARTPQKTGSRMLQYLTWSPGFGKSVPAAAVMSSPKSAISETTTAAATTKTTRRRAAKIKPAAATSVKRKKVETRVKTSRKASGCVARQHNTEAVVPITVPRAMQRRVHPILPRISMPLQLSMPIVMAPTLQVLPAAHLYRAPITPAFLPQPVAVETTMPRVSSAQKTTRPFRDMSCRREPRASRRRSTPATPSGTSRRATKHAELPPAAMPAGGASSHDTSGGTAALVGSPSAASQARGGAPPSMPSLDEESQAQLPLDVVFQLFGLSPVKPSTAETDDARISTTSSETLKPSTADAGDKSISVTSSETPGSATMLTSSRTTCSATMADVPERVKVFLQVTAVIKNKVPPRGETGCC